MPLIILGLVVIIGITIYGLIIYASSDERDTRPVRERYPHVFPSRKKDSNYTVIDDEDDEKAGSGENTLFFPVDAEREKRRRNIN